MKGFVIRISNNDFSANLAKEAFDSCKSNDVDVEYFEAIVPLTLNNFFDTYGVRMSDQFLSKKIGELPTQACFASHYCLWKKCADLNEKILILEHDGILLRSIRDIINKIDDVCHLDPNRPYSINYHEKIQKAQPYGIKDFGLSNKATIDREYTGQHFAGTYAYIISPVGAKKIIDFVKNYGAWESDRLIGEKILKLQITLGSYARLNPFFISKEYIKKYSLRVKSSN